MQSEIPLLPLIALQSAAGEHTESHAAIEDFRAEYASEKPDPKRLEAHAARLRAFPAIVGPFERWWLNPRVQEFIAELGATGI